MYGGFFYARFLYTENHWLGEWVKKPVVMSRIRKLPLL